MDILDVVLLILCVLFGISGYRQGFIVGVLSFAGLIGGALLAATYAAALHRALGMRGNGAVFGLVTFVVLAALGQVLGSFVGWLIRRRLTWSPVRTVDSLGGGLIGAASVLFVAWLVGTAATATEYQTLNREVLNSRILGVVQQVLPSGLRTLAPPFRRLLNDSGFPQVFTEFGPQPDPQVAAPDRRLAHSRVVRQTRPAVFKVRGIAPSCSRQLEGSGFVFAPGRVMTNAHVVAGVENPTVIAPDGTATYPARVVLYDPDRDVAVLAVPGLQAPPLHFGGPVSRGASAIVLGYPENGGFTAGAARIRDTEKAAGLNIYQDRPVSRQIYAIYATVRPGNSGGPLISPSGTVDGVVFAASTDHPNTGYALTAEEVAGDAQRGAKATAPVSTQGCD
jgi:S1-C subfamily serine protease